MASAPANPLLASDLFPLYDKVTLEDVVPGIRALLAEVRRTWLRLRRLLPPAGLGWWSPWSALRTSWAARGPR